MFYELADNVLIIHNKNTIFDWQIGRTVDEATDIITLEYPSLVEG